MQADDQTYDRRVMGTTGRLAIWTLAWVLTLALASFGPPLLWNDHPVLSWIAIAINLAAGVGWIIAHALFLRRVDDLQRKIMLDAIALALGVGIVGGCALAAAKNIGLVSFDSDIAILTVAMSLVYILTVAIGAVRYR